jgi:hypothetical protein
VREKEIELTMPSAKGKPTDPKLKEKVTEGMFFSHSSHPFSISHSTIYKSKLT